MIQKILLPALLAMVFCSGTTVHAQRPERTTIADIAIQINQNTGEFSSLIAALTKVDTELNAGLITTLDGNRQFTVFAPTDEAFDAAAVAVLGVGNTGADLVNDLPAELLLDILTYHVAPGSRNSTDVEDSDRVRTISRSFTFPFLENGRLFLEDVDSLGLNSPDAEIVLPDVFADNGVIHVINWVLIP